MKLSDGTDISRMTVVQIEKEMRRIGAETRARRQYFFAVVFTLWVLATAGALYHLVTR